MSTTLLNRVTFRKDGVYLSTKDLGSEGGYKSWKSGTLSRTYLEQGKKAADAEILRMLWEGQVQVRGSHRSIAEYSAAMRDPEADALWTDSRMKQSDTAFYMELARLCEDIRERWRASTDSERFAELLDRMGAREYLMEERRRLRDEYGVPVERGYDEIEVNMLTRWLRQKDVRCEATDVADYLGVRI